MKSFSFGGELFLSHLLWFKMILVVAFSFTGFFILWRKYTSLRKYVLIAAVIVNGFFMGGFLCPVAVVQNVLFHPLSYLLLFSLPLLISTFFGRLYCGYSSRMGLFRNLCT